MKYDFTSIIDRRGHDASAVDNIIDRGMGPRVMPEDYDPVPMWVADMNFPCYPGITDAMKKRLEHPTFGYFPPRQEYFDAIINWQKVRNGVEGLTRENIGYENGVLGGVVSALNIYCSKGAPVLVHNPLYVGFSGVLNNNGYKIIASDLVPDENDVLRMDFEDMEKKIVENKVHAAIMCNPHNPAGRVWERWELEKAMELYKKYDVFVISDEIWSDIIMPGHKHIPTQSVSEDAKNRTIAFYAPSKTFNLAGLIGSYHIVYNKYLNDRLLKESSLSHYNSMNVMSMHALIGAFDEGGMQWVDELCETIDKNIDCVQEHFAKHKGVHFRRAEGTYMVFVDFTEWCQDHGVDIEELLHRGWDAGVVWQDGRRFFGPCHIRMNLASPLSRIETAMKRVDAILDI